MFLKRQGSCVVVPVCTLCINKTLHGLIVHCWSRVLHISWLTQVINLPIFIRVAQIVSLTKCETLQSVNHTWWRHQMETFSALLALCDGNPQVTSQRPVTRSFDVFFGLSLNKRLSKQSRRRWFETPSLSLRHHCNVCIFLGLYALCIPISLTGSHQVKAWNLGTHTWLYIIMIPCCNICISKTWFRLIWTNSP